MKINFKKITALATSALMVGMTMGVAAAANYPAPFVSGGAADVAIVYGTGSGVSQLDLIEAGNVQTNLQSFMTGTGSGGAVSTSGETVSLDTSADRIWLNTSLNSVKSTLTKSDLPTILADYTFSGDVTSKVTSTVKTIAGAAAGGDNSGKVIFTKQPSSSNDPAIGISMGASATSNALYNASATMSAINFTHADSEGEEIVLFGQSFTIAAETDLTSIVLLKDAEKVDLTSDAPTASVTVGGSAYTIELVSASDTSATIKVTNSAGVSASKEISEAASKRINGIDIAVTNADETNLKLSATITAGSEKVTLTSGSIVTVGENDDPVDGTLAYIAGGIGATTEIAITVFRPDSTDDAILPGTSFVDPVFGSFKVDFAGLSSPLDDANRDIISVGVAGDDTMTLKFKEQGGNEKTIDFAHNESGVWKLGDDSNFSYATVEMANISYASNIGSGGLGTSDDGVAKYVVVGNEDYGHLLELYDVYNQTTSTSAITNDRVKFKDVFTAETFETTFSATEGVGTMDVDGKRYTVYFNGTGEDGYVQLKYPTSDSDAVNKYVVFPTIETSQGALVQLVQPTLLNLTDMNSSTGRNDGLAGTQAIGGGAQILLLPDGDGYTSVTLTNNATAGYDSAWKVGSNTTANLLTNTTATTYNAIGLNTNVTFTVGTVSYRLTSLGVANLTQISIVDPEGAAVDSAALIDQPAVVVYENKDDNTEYHAVVVDLLTAPAGSSTTPVEVNDVLFSSDYYHNAATRASDSDFTEDIDWFGTLVTKDNTDTASTVTISYPKAQVYANIYVGASGSAVTGGSSAGGSTQLGNVLVKDSEASSVATKNLVVVGGSCINSAAATLVGGAKCGAAWTTATGVGAGEFLIKGYATSSLTSKVALLVAGYEAADTVNAATYLRTKTVDTSKEYKGTSSTSATLVTTSA
jgi:hypothetical protein